MLGSQFQAEPWKLSSRPRSEAPQARRHLSLKLLHRACNLELLRPLPAHAHLHLPHSAAATGLHIVMAGVRSVKLVGFWPWRQLAHEPPAQQNTSTLQIQLVRCARRAPGTSSSDVTHHSSYQAVHCHCYLRQQRLSFPCACETNLVSVLCFLVYEQSA